MQLGSSVGVTQRFNTIANFGKCHGADIELFQWLRRDKSDDLCLRFQPAQFRQHVGIEQKTAQRPATPRSRLRLWSYWLEQHETISENSKSGKIRMKAFWGRPEGRPGLVRL
jgi:hypothetical protein